jgi:Bacterial Ig-like domain (group 3)/FG-GAP-like repeat
MLHKHRFPLAAALILCLLSPTAASAGDCFPVWGNAPYISIPMTDPPNARRVAADFNGDGKSDLGTSSRTEVFVALMGANGQLHPAVKIGTGENLLSLQAADVNGDQKIDLVTNDAARNAIVVFPGLGDGSFGPPVESSVSVTPHEIVTGDFNGDAKADVAFASDSGFVGILLGDDTGTFEAGAAHFPTTAVRFLTAGDFDGDGKLDLLGRTSAVVTTLRLFRGTGNGTFSTPADFAGSAENIRRDASDLDGDGDLDLVTADFNARQISVLLNQGSGAFAPPVLYPTIHSAADVAVFDVTRDGIPDATVALVNHSSLATFPGKGDGTFAPAIHSIPTYLPPGSMEQRGASPLWSEQADVDGDGAKDDLLIYLANASRFGTLINQCGGVKITPTFTPPVVSVGQESILSVTIAAPGHIVGTAPAKPSGEVKLYEGTALLGSGTLADGAVTFHIPKDLGAAKHTLRIAYPGDDHYDAAESTAELTVTDVTIAVAVDFQETSVAYPERVLYTVTATASDGSIPSGSELGIYRDGVLWRRVSSIFGGQIQSLLTDLEPGEHTFQFRYEGNSIDPPSPLSDPVHVTVVKGESNVAFDRVSESFRAGEPGGVLISSNGIGLVSLYDGTTLLETKTTPAQGFASFTVTFNTTGPHTLIARRHDSNTYHASEASLEVRVLPQGAAAIDVTCAGGAIQVWWDVSTVNSVDIKLERLNGGVWTAWPRDGNPTTIPNPAPGVPYIFRMRLFDPWQGTLVATSNVDGVMVTAFTDEPLAAGTRIKALHFTQLLAGINAWRGAVGLQPLSVPNVAAGNLVRAADITAMRNGLTQARSAAGVAPVSFTAVTAKQTKIRAADVQQLRDLLVR